MGNQSKDLSNEKETYCEMFNVDPSLVDDDFVEHYFEKHATQHMEILKDGYLQMADVNASICKEFALSECDCDNLKRE